MRTGGGASHPRARRLIELVSAHPVDEGRLPGGRGPGVMPGLRPGHAEHHRQEGGADEHDRRARLHVVATMLVMSSQNFWWVFGSRTRLVVAGRM